VRRRSALRNREPERRLAQTLASTIFKMAYTKETG
jgi:hypothetical protein